MPELPSPLNMIEFWLLLAAAFAALAALSAFLITYREYAQHRLGSSRTLQQALSSALFAALFFFAGTLIVGLALSRLLHAP